MRKSTVIIVLLLICVFMITSCRPDLNYIISYKPSIEGYVLQISENSILIENPTGQYWVSTDVEYSDGEADLSVGDIVDIFYEGVIGESYPMQINKVYAIFLVEPVDRDNNNRS